MCTISAISSLPPWSLRVGLAGEDELHRPVLVVEDRRQPVEVAEDQRRRACRWRSGGRSRWSAPRGRAPRRRAAISAGGAPRRFELRPAAGRGRRRPAARGGARGSATARRRGCARRASRRRGRSAAPPTGCRGSGRRAAPISGDSQLCVWTPLVIDVIGTSAVGQLGPDAPATSCATRCRAAC